MAKKKVKVEAGCCPSDYSPSIYLDVGALKELGKVTVGSEVTVVIKGKVRSIEQREDYDDPKKVNGSLSLKDFEVEITSGSDVWDELMEGEDE